MIRPAPFLRFVVVGIVVAMLFAACTSDEPEPPLSASPTALPTSTDTPAPIMSPTPPASGEARRTGSPELDAIIEAVEARDLAVLAPLVAYQEVGCTHVEGMGGPPKCSPDQAEGEIMVVFPGAGCHGYWTDTATQHLGTLAHRAQGLYAVAAVAGDVSLGGEWPVADTLLIFHADWFGEPAAFRLHLADGRIVASRSGCGPRPPADLLEDGVDGAVSLIAGPWDEPIEGEASVPSVGVPGLDAILDAMARYDVGALDESAQRGMQVLPDAECVAEPTVPGDVMCNVDKGEGPGDLVDVLPLTYCTPDLVRDPAPPIRAFLNGGPVLHSVLDAPGEESTGLFQHGRYWIVYELVAGQGDLTEAARLQVGAEGELLRIWYGCAPNLRELVTWEQAPLPRIDVTEVVR